MTNSFAPPVTELPRRRVGAQQAPSPLGTPHTLVGAENAPYPFGLRHYQYDRQRLRPVNRAVLMPQVQSTGLLLKSLQFIWLPANGGISYGGVASYSSNVTQPPGAFDTYVTQFPGGVFAGTFSSSIGNLAGVEYRSHFQRVSIHSPWPPYERMAELPSAFHIDRSYQRMAHGQAALSIAPDDPQLSDDVLDFGNLLVIESDYMPTWVGMIIDIKQSVRTPATEIHALSLESILDARVTSQSEKYTNVTGSYAVFRNLINHMNLRGHTGIFLSPVQQSTPAVQDLQVGGQSVMQALNELHTRTDYEWWIEYDVTPQHVISFIHWGWHQGQDYSDSVHLYDGMHYTEFEYDLDLTQVKASMIAIGDFGAELGQRTSVLRGVKAGQHITVDIGTTAGEKATELAARSIDSLPAGLRSERIVYDLMTNTYAELANRARRQLERPLAGAEKFNITVNLRADWTKFAVGNYITVHANPGYEEITRRVRIVSMQPDEERGEVVLACEVPVI